MIDSKRLLKNQTSISEYWKEFYPLLWPAVGTEISLRPDKYAGLPHESSGVKDGSNRSSRILGSLKIQNHWNCLVLLSVVPSTVVKEAVSRKPTMISGGDCLWLTDCFPECVWSMVHSGKSDTWSIFPEHALNARVHVGPSYMLGWNA